MKTIQSFAAKMLALVVFAFAQALFMPFSAAAATQPPSVPDKIAVKPGSSLLFSRHARGVQVYECVNSAWTLHAPRAVLFDPDTNGAVGFHYGGIDRNRTPGPWWESKADGSAVRGAKVADAPSPDGSIPWLLLNVVQWENSGEFAAVAQIQRLNTTGGVSPTGSCKAGMMRVVPYTADYFFYAAP